MSTFVEVTPLDQRTNISIGDAALEHPEAAIRMDIGDPSSSDRFVGRLNRTRNGVGGFDFGLLDVDDAETKPYLRGRRASPAADRGTRVIPRRGDARSP